MQRGKRGLKEHLGKQLAQAKQDAGKKVAKTSQTVKALFGDKMQKSAEAAESGGGVAPIGNVLPEIDWDA